MILSETQTYNCNAGICLVACSRHEGNGDWVHMGRCKKIKLSSFRFLFAYRNACFANNCEISIGHVDLNIFTLKLVQTMFQHYTYIIFVYCENQPSSNLHVYYNLCQLFLKISNSQLIIVKTHLFSKLLLNIAMAVQRLDDCMGVGPTT